jgi:isopenicillin-N N-acyltransferase-like protein
MRFMRFYIYALVLLMLAIGTCPLHAAQPPVNVALHGKRFTVGAGDNRLTVLYLQGTPYEMGYAHGKLCAKEVRYLAEQVAPLMMLGMGCSPSRVDAIWKLYEKHLRPDYLEELKGLADGSGVPLRDIERLSAIPDISQWSCSFFAADGKATEHGDLIQIRALDYTTNAGIQKYPALIVYKPNHGVPFVNVGWLGFCGVVTALNADTIAMSEIGDDWDKKTNNFDGRPLTYVMRDAVQFGTTLQEAIHQVRDYPRTLSILYCLSWGKTGQMAALQTSHDKCYVYNSTDLPFPTKPGMVYMSMGMNSNWNAKLGHVLLQDYGHITVPVAEQIMHELKTGSLHAVVFKPATGDLWVANATAHQMAYDRPFLHFNLFKALSDPFFKQPAPNSTAQETSLAPTNVR